MVSLRQSGFALVEVLLALAIVGWVILAAAAFAQARTAAAVRLAARQRVQTAVEVALESVRSGVMPLADGRFEIADQLPVDPGDPLARVDVDIAVRPAGVDDLFLVSVRGRTEVAGSPVDDVVWTMAWRP